MIGIIATLAAGTLLLRLSLLAPDGDARLPPPIGRGLQLVAPAVLAALVAPAVLAPDGHLLERPDDPRLVAGLVALGTAALTRNVLATLVVGMGTLWVLRALLAG